MKPISVVLLTSADMYMAFMKHYNKSKLTVAAHFATAAEAAAKLPALSHAFFVIDTAILDTAALNIIISALTAEKVRFICLCKTASDGFMLLSKGALDMIIHNGSNTDQEQIRSICTRIAFADEKYQASLKRRLKYTGSARSDKIVLIGSSTGGAETVTHILKQLPADMPPIVVAQHMPPVFTNLYAERLNDVCKLTVWEAKDRDELLPGTALIAPGDYQIRLTRQDGKILADVYNGEKVNGHAPSVDVLFYSGAALLGKKAVGVILTGMGKDGAAGLLAMRNAGAYTIGQDKSSSIVYGMPKAAYDMGAVSQQAHLNDIAKCILDNL